MFAQSSGSPGLSEFKSGSILLYPYKKDDSGNYLTESHDKNIETILIIFIIGLIAGPEVSL